jgi:hypothetical protein
VHLALALGISCATIATPSGAQSGDAQRRFGAGVALFDRREYQRAVVEFQSAYALSGRPSVLFNLAATYVALQRYPAAIDVLERFLALGEGTTPGQRADAAAQLDALVPLIARLMVRTTPVTTSVSLDGATVDSTNNHLVLTPGVHSIEVSAPGYRSSRRDVTVVAGDAQDIHVVLVPLRIEAPSGALEPRVFFTILGAPRHASIAIAGAILRTSDRLELDPGIYPVTIFAAEMQPWSGEVRLHAGTAPRLRVYLAPARQTLPLWGFGLSAGVAATASVSATITGALALQTAVDFASRASNDPALDALEARGRSLGLATDALIVSAVIAAAVTVTFALLVPWGARPSTAELLVARRSSAATRTP